MKSLIHISAGALLLLFTGCMGYELGGSRPAGVESVYIEPIINRTEEPAIELQVMHALRERIQFDGRFRLQATPDTADARIEVTLNDYKLRAIAFRDDLQTAPQQYRLRISATAVLKARDTEEILTRSSTYGESRFVFESDLTTSKRIALPQAAEELARFMLDDLIEQWD